jgi:hypothetical protein
MARKPNPLLEEFLDENITLPEIDWETVPSEVNPYDAWEMFDENVEGWVPVWFPVGDPKSGKSFKEFERLCLAAVVLRSKWILSEGLGHRAWSKKPGVRIQNSEEKQLKLSSSQLLATDYWLLDSLISDCGITNNV